MRELKKPLKIANELITILDIAFGYNRYPVDIKKLALDYSKQKFPDDYIKEIKGQNLSGFEGALYKKTNKETLVGLFSIMIK